MSFKRFFWPLVFVVSAAIIYYLSSSPLQSNAEVMGDQLRLFNISVNMDAGSASGRPSHNDSALPANWLSPTNWTTGPVYWKVTVTGKKSTLPLRLDLHFEREHPDGQVGAEEIAEAAHMIETTTVGQTLYAKLNPLSQWLLYTNWIPSWEWTKPINGIYIIIYAFDDSKNQWVWFAGPSVCSGYDFCFGGSAKQADHLPMSIQTEAYATQAGKEFARPASWADCPASICGNGPIITTVPGVSPSVVPTVTPSGCDKSKGDADCTNGATVLDYAVWRIEYKGGCSSTNLTEAACGDNKDGTGSIMDADFNNDGKTSLPDYQIWRNNVH